MTQKDLESIMQFTKNFFIGLDGARFNQMTTNFYLANLSQRLQVIVSADMPRKGQNDQVILPEKKV